MYENVLYLDQLNLNLGKQENSVNLREFLFKKM